MLWVRFANLVFIVQYCFKMAVYCLEMVSNTIIDIYWYFRKCLNVDDIWDFGPLTSCRNSLKTDKKSNDVFEPHYFCKSEGLKSLKWCKLGVWHVLKVQNVIWKFQSSKIRVVEALFLFWILALWNFETLKLLCICGSVAT